MTVPRAVMTVTRLHDGRILVAGGCTTDGCDLASPGGATAELFDPASATFTRTGDLTSSRDDHAAVLLPDGRVMLIGGWGADRAMASTDIFDPTTGRFSPGPTMHSKRAGIVPVELKDGRILFAGGFIETRPTTSSADLYDPATATMVETGPLSVPRGAYAAAGLADGRVLFAGGLSDGTVVSSAELYDPATGTFRPTGSMTIPRYKGAAVTLADGSILVFGGSGDIDGTMVYSSTEIFDPVSGTFRNGPAMRAARYKLPDSSVVLRGGDVFIAGGAPRPEVYRAATGSFAQVAGDLGATRLFLAAAAIDDHRVLLVGGYDRAIRPTATAWLFDADAP